MLQAHRGDSAVGCWHAGLTKVAARVQLGLNNKSFDEVCCLQPVCQHLLHLRGVGLSSICLQQQPRVKSALRPTCQNASQPHLKLASDLFLCLTEHECIISESCIASDSSARLQVQPLAIASLHQPSLSCTDLRHFLYTSRAGREDILLCSQLCQQQKNPPCTPTTLPLPHTNFT